MTGPLGLGFEEEAPAPPRRRRVGRALGILSVVVVLAVVVGGGFVVARGAKHLFGGPGDYSGPGTGSVTVQVHAGDSATAIGKTLAAAGVVKSAGAFSDAADGDSRSRAIAPGFYKLRLHMRAALALSLMLDPKSLVEKRVTVPEGFTVADVEARLAKNAGLSAAAVTAASTSPSALGAPSWGEQTLEGFLFPATYNLDPSVDAKGALSTMVAKFTQTAASVGLDKPHHGLSSYQLLTLASIVQREGRLTQDYPQIAEVFYNRLSRGMRLDSDATLYYKLGPSHGPLTASDLKLDTPYNTRLHAGLPPTPINNPGVEAMKAVLNPPTGPYLYFVTIDKAGHTAFAKTLSEFQTLVAKSRANGVS